MDVLVFFQSAWTVVVFILFIGIAWWTFSSKQTKEFEEAARIPLDDDDDIPAPRQEKHNNV